MIDNRPIEAHANTQSAFVRGVVADIILTLVTCGLYNLYVQYMQMKAVNAMLGEQRYSWLAWLLLTIVTCGLYHIYHEYKKSYDIAHCLKEPHSNEPLVNLILTLFGLSIVADALQQAQINRYYGNHGL